MIRFPVSAKCAVCFLLAGFFCLSPVGCGAKAPGRIMQMTGASLQLPVLNWQKRSDWINVKTDVSPAAAGDGVHDDTAALQAALNQISDASGAPHVVYLPPGTYRITQTLTLTKIQGALLIGQGRGTRIVWDGSSGGVMYESNGVTRSRYIGIVWDGAGKAAVGIDHHSKTYYETRIRHQDEAFVNFQEAGIRAGNNQQTPSAEMIFRNCLFLNCGSGAEFLSWNDYNNDFDGCEFQNCGTAINCQKGNVYVRDCRFQNSAQTDIFLCSHSHSILRCVSVGSKQFLATTKGNATLELMVEDCRVDGWTGDQGAINLSMRGPTTVFDCVFTHAPDQGSPIRLTNSPSALQLLTISDTSSPNTAHVVDRGPNSDIVLIPEGSRHGCLLTGSERFFAQSETVPGKIFDVKTDFGAKGNGRADDTQAVLSAVQAARAYGNGAIAYLPSGDYNVSRTIPLTGGDYTVGGSGFGTNIHWHGADNGIVFAVRDPQNVTLEQMQISADAESVCRVQQTSAGGASSVVYDGVYVKSSFLGPTSHGGENGHIEEGHEVRALECVNLPAGAVVHARHFDGTMRLINCGRATILTDFSVDGVIHVTGTAPDSGFLGYSTKVTSGTPCDLVVEDNQSIVIGDFYTESTQKHVLLIGSDDPAVPPGHVTIHGTKVQTYDTEPVTINNYRGRFTYSNAHFVYQPYSITHTGSNPVDILLLGNMFWKGKPALNKGSGAHISLLQNEVAGQDVPDTQERITNKAKDSEISSAATLSGEVPNLDIAADALDDFRALGVVDLRLNHAAL